MFDKSPHSMYRGLDSKIRIVAESGPLAEYELARRAWTSIYDEINSLRADRIREMTNRDFCGLHPETEQTNARAVQLLYVILDDIYAKTQE